MAANTKTNRQVQGEGTACANGSDGAEAATDGRDWTVPPRLEFAGTLFAELRSQQILGLSLVAISLALIISAGIWFGSDPLSGIEEWLSRGVLQAVAGGLFAFAVWTLLNRRFRASYLLLLGLACFGFAIWDLTMGVRGNQMRREANEILVTFRDEPLNATGIADAIERNPYVEAYVVMRDAYWELNDRLDARLADYSAAYRQYVKEADFLDIERLKSRYVLWQAFYQVEDLEARLDDTQASPLEVQDLLWTIDLLDVDRRTRNAYSEDLNRAIEDAIVSQAALLDRERRTLAHIKKSLKVLIDSKGRYRISEGRVIFDDPVDAARFAGKLPSAD